MFIYYNIRYLNNKSVKIILQIILIMIFTLMYIIFMSYSY